MRKKILTIKTHASHFVLFSALILLGEQNYAATTDISPSPLANTSPSSVKPNLMFILDDSGSMAWTHVPDDAVNNRSNSCYKSSAYNPLYFDPNKTYAAPIKADGTFYPNATFTGAWYDGYNTGAGTLNLSTSFRADIFLGSTSGNDTAQAAYYMSYTGTSPATPVAAICYPDSSYTKINVATASAAVKQNFANWFSYYRSRMQTMRTGSGLAFSTLGNTFRVGFTTINYTGTSDTSTEFLSIKDFDATQKSTFYTRLYSQAPGSSTPLRPALSKVGRIFAGKIGTDPVQYSCQQNFTLLSTDGFWNGGTGYKENGTTLVGDQDNDISATPRPYFQGPGTTVTVVTTTTTKSYNVTTSGCSGGKKKRTLTTTTDTRTMVTNNGFQESDTTSNSVSGPNTDIACSSGSVTNPSPNPQVSTTTTTSSAASPGIADTLSDVAMYYYRTDLRPSSGTCNTGVAGADVCENNVPGSGTDTATWQHMTTFTMGLGVNGLLKYRSDYDTATSGDYYDIKTGVKNWPVPQADDLTAVDDLWHAAVNGHGKYFSAKDPDSVVAGIQGVLSAATARLGAGTAAATSNLEPVAGDNFAFVANYRTVAWDGDLQAKTIDPNSGKVSVASTWSAQSLLDARASDTSDTRAVYMFKSTGSTKLQDFTPANFTAAQKTSWFDTTKLSQYSGFDATEKTNATADSLINYLRGQKVYDNTLYRHREHLLGDIVSGKPVYAKKTPFTYLDAGHDSFRSDTGDAGSGRKGMVYTASNDGMLHAFESLTGNELWAYIPTAVLPNLYKLADNSYSTNHQFYADGAPVIADIQDGPKWKTILVAGLNAGGRSYYALDITKPDSPVALWEFTDTNLGLTHGNPIVTKLKDGTWVVIFGSGYNNVSPGDGVGRLYIVNAATGALIRTISTGVGSTGTPSGLAKISGWVESGLTDNTTLRVYGGDLLGNLWRFDINDVLGPPGFEAFNLAQFKYGGVAQPITTSPEVALVDDHVMLYVGTGRYLGLTDLTDTSQQSLYAVKDNLDTTSLGDARANVSCPLVKQDITTLSDTERSTSSNTVDLSAKCGWYMDFNPGGKSPGERVTVDPRLQLGVLTVASNVPDNSVCRSSGYSWLYFLDFRRGTFVTGVDKNVAGSLFPSTLTVGITVVKTTDGKTVTIRTGSAGDIDTKGNPKNINSTTGARRVNWREITDE